MKVHVSEAKNSDLFHFVLAAAANVPDLTPTIELLPREEEVVDADAGDKVIASSPEMTDKTTVLRVAMRAGQGRFCPTQQMIGCRI